MRCLGQNDGKRDTFPKQEPAVMNIAVRAGNLEVLQSLVGKVSLVTGSISTIGLGIARALVAAGSEIILNGFGKPQEVADVQDRAH
jgi:3-hydroxybutyrate dehydrogenase